ncbi:MAG: IlvD/Edd family dehydratase [Acetobacteraceae bacterium]
MGALTPPDRPPTLTPTKSVQETLMPDDTSAPRRLRSRGWFDNPANPSMTALYLERYMNFGLTPAELRSGRPIIGIAQTGSDLAPCNRHHVALASRVRDGIRDAGGIPLEFPIHPIQETGKRPTAALDRNLAYLSLVEVLHGYPLDGVVLTAGCDKTVPAVLMGAATVNLPAILLSGGPMLDGWYNGRLAGSGTIVWEARKLLAEDKIDYEQFMDMVAASASSVGHCNTMGTALSMNSLAEVLGMSLPGCAAIPGPHKERGWMAYNTGLRIVGMVAENLRPSDIMTKPAFENAVVAATALGASSNCPISMVAIARHMGVDHTLDDWQRLGADIPLLTDVQPAGRFLGEGFFRAGGVPAVLHELIQAGKLQTGVMTCTGKTLAENIARPPAVDREVIRAYDKPMMQHAGFAVLSGNLFDAAVMKISVIDREFRNRFLSDPDKPNVFEGKAIVFEGPEDYHDRIEDPALGIDQHSVLIIRNCGPVGYPGGAEVVNMQPPAALLKAGVNALPTMGDGRQSGTSGSPSILNVSPEAVVGGGLALLQTGDRIRIDLNTRKVDVLIPEPELASRRQAWTPPVLPNKTPWEEIYRSMVGQHATGACLEPATLYLDILETRGESRHSH